MTSSTPRVVVVGAGAIGLFVALALALRGARVRVIDGAARIMAPSDRSASARAAGLLGPLSEQLNEPPDAHPDLLALGLASLAIWPEQARRLAGGGSPDALIDARGALLVAHSGPFAGELQRLLRRAREAGAPARLVSPREVHQLAPAVTNRVDYGVLLEAEAQIRPGPVMVALLRALRGLTGEEVRVAEARGLLIEGGRCVGVRVRPRALGEEEAERADAVVLAPGAWASAELMADVPALAKITPTKGHLIEVATAPGALPLPVRAERVYVAPRGPRLTRVGATMEPGKRDHSVDPAEVRHLQAALAGLAPELAEAPVLSQWAGVRAMSPDWGPMIGRTGPAGLFLAGGHSRNGWLLGPITGRLIADAVFEEQETPFAHAFRPDRFG